jgi:glycosyltransferase involved in cell wall biosynthesis
MRPLHIAQIVEATVGGVARHVTDLVTHLDPATFVCSLYLSCQRADHDSTRLRELSAQGFCLREVPMARVPNGAAVRQLATWLRQDSIDLVHVHSAKAGYLGRLAADQLGIPVIYTPHAFPFQRTTDWRRPFFRMIERRLAAWTARIICVSESEREEALAAGLPAKPLVVIPNGMDLTEWTAPTVTQRANARQALGHAPGDIVVGALARLVPQKGLDLLLAAADEFLPDFPSAHLLIWGDGPERKSLERMARQLRLPRTEFRGATMSPWDAFAAMDIFTAPSRWEAGPYAVLEAMASGVPVVASSVAGHRDYVEDDHSGLLVEAELPDPLDGALRALLIDADRRDFMGRAARHRVEQYFTLQAMVARTADLYQEVIAEEMS